MRILHTNMLRGWGGQSNRILTEALGVRDAGHEIAFIVPHDSVLAGKAAEAGMTVFPHYRIKPPAQVWHFGPDLRRYLRDVRSWRPDIVHLHGSPDTWLAVVARRFLGAQCPPLLRTKHNIFPWARHGANRWLYRHLDAFISISGYITRQLEDFPGFDGRPHACIPSVPDLPRLLAPVASVRDELGAPAGAFIWGSTGRLRAEKAFDVLLPAFAKLRATHPAAYLVIAGDGSERASLETRAASLGLGPEAMRFLGFRSDVPAILRSVDAYALASRSEGLGTAILEALAAGLPVVATNVGGIPDSVHHERTGLLAPSEDPAALAAAMARIMDDAPLRQRLGAAAHEFVTTEFTMEKLTARTLAFYQQVIATGVHPRR